MFGLISAEFIAVNRSAKLVHEAKDRGSGERLCDLYGFGGRLDLPFSPQQVLAWPLEYLDAVERGGGMAG